uniref:FAD-binding PCMH-type domain-containing protein n=1 Tax=Rhabditophanes sp. KR3021 TaxID=114890 RepID=A0AC35U5A9_9BILA
MFDAINGNKLGTAKQDKLYKHKPLESEMEEKTNIIKLEPMLAMLSKQVINDSKFANNNSTLDANRHNCRNDLNDNIKINQNDLSYKQLEHQFLDLAKISNGKDIIIEGQRKELRESNEKLTSLTKLFNNAKDELLLTKDKVMAIEKELDIFVELGKDQKDLENLLQEERKKLEHEICKNESLLKNIANLESENLALKTELTRTSQKFSELEFLINNLGRDKRSLKIELEETCDQLTQKCKDLNALNEELAHDNITLIEREQKAITQLEQITKDQYEQRDHWDEVLQKNETQISELTSSLFNAKNEFNNLVDINDELSRSPESAKQVSSILKYCYDKNLAVVTQSGNTGLVGGSIPVHDEIILSMKRMNRNFCFDSISGIVKCDSGYILEELNQKLAPHRYTMPVDLGAKGSCLIGGNVATSAGGIRMIRYGSMHANVLGLQVVLPDKEGSVVNFGSGLRKDNTDLHLAHLFVGSEGQLGIITNVQMLAVSLPSSVNTAMLAVPNFESCKKILALAKNKLGEILTSFEFLDNSTMECVNTFSKVKIPFDEIPPFALLIETTGNSIDSDKERMEKFLAECFEEEYAFDGVSANGPTEAAALWDIREGAPLSVVKEGYVYNIHPFIYEWVIDHGGSISAEHGIGQLKRPYYQMGVCESRKYLSKSVKTLFDPKGILNPYKFVSHQS